jgi:pilus assembly protein Flp/PilA
MMTGFTISSSAMMRLASRFRRDESGATAIEYAMIAAGIGATIATTVWGLGSAIKETWWDKIANVIS